MITEDLIGSRVGKLVVISEGPTVIGAKRSDGSPGYRWRRTYVCKCDCGNITSVERNDLIRGDARHIKSCGCAKKGCRLEDLMGRRFGRLVVIGEATPFYRKNKSYGQTRWFCRCDCGRYLPVIAESMKRGTATHCGCKLEESRKANALAGAIKCTVAAMKRNAIARGYEFELTDNEVTELIFKPCMYCGGEPNMQISRSRTASILANGIDRVNNSIGYIKNNCVPCCAMCNRAKWSYTADEFLKHVELIYRHSISKGSEPVNA